MRTENLQPARKKICLFLFKTFYRLVIRKIFIQPFV